MAEPIKTVLLDMDGVLANFVGGAIKAHRKDLKHDDVTDWDWYETEWGMTAEEFWKPLNNQKFWERLEVYPQAYGLMSLLKGSDWEIVYCTRPSECKESVTGKLNWLRANGLLSDGGHVDQFIPTSRKDRLARPDVLLIDDSGGNVDAFRAAGGQAILYPQPWNANRDHKASPNNFVAAELEAICEQTSKPAVAKRDNTGKPEMSQLLHFRLEALAAHCSAGRKKYPDIDGTPNWRLGGKPDAEYLDAASRHLAKIVRGEIHDEETGTMHAAAVAWNMLAMITNNYQEVPVG